MFGKLKEKLKSWTQSLTKKAEEEPIEEIEEITVDESKPEKPSKKEKKPQKQETKSKAKEAEEEFSKIQEEKQEKIAEKVEKIKEEMEKELDKESILVTETAKDHKT